MPAFRVPFADGPLGRGVDVGGVYPFRLPVTADFARLPGAKHFRQDFPDRDALLRLRRAIHAPEHGWREERILLYHESRIAEIRLSSGRRLTDVPLQAYLTLYAGGIATLCFWAALGDEEFRTQELIELCALARGTPERIDPTADAGIRWRLDDRPRAVTSLVEVCDHLADEVRGATTGAATPDPAGVRFVHPIVYVRCVPGCVSGTQIAERYAWDIASVLHLWVSDGEWQKKREIEAALATDIHPFEYGLTALSATATVELHPEGLEVLARDERLTLPQHHFEERSYLTALCEVAIAQFYTLRVYDAELSAAARTPMPAPRWNPTTLLALMRSAVSLNEFERRVTRNVSDFRYLHLTRKAYQVHAVNAYRSALGTARVEESLDRRLRTIREGVSLTYNMLTAMFGLVLSAAALTLAVVQVVQVAGCGAARETAGPAAVSGPRPAALEVSGPDAPSPPAPGR